MQVRSLSLPEVLEVTPKKFGDARGFFAETWSEKAMRDAGLPVHWVQDNHSFSASPHVLRGLHYQTPPMAQDKLVRVVKGRIWDVAVDIRKGSPRYGQWTALEISAEVFNQIFVPKGFAHGFLTLTPDTEVVYKVSAPYAPDCDRCIRWDDPAIGVAWPLSGALPQLSTKDTAATVLAAQDTGFDFSEMTS